MFRHDVREKPVLYKEIIKAISKRELLEDLCFCACRKIICLASIAVTPGKQPYYTTFRASLAGLVPLATLRKLHPSVVVQWLCHRETVAQTILRHGVNHLCAVRGM